MSLMRSSRCRPLSITLLHALGLGRAQRLGVVELHQLGEAEHRVQRRAQLVAHARQELALRAVRAFGRFLVEAQAFGLHVLADVAAGCRSCGVPAVGAHPGAQLDLPGFPSAGSTRSARPPARRGRWPGAGPPARGCGRGCERLAGEAVAVGLGVHRGQVGHRPRPARRGPHGRVRRPSRTRRCPRRPPASAQRSLPSRSARSEASCWLSSRAIITRPAHASRIVGSSVVHTTSRFDRREASPSRSENCRSSWVSRTSSGGSWMRERPQRRHVVRRRPPPARGCAGPAARSSSIARSASAQIAMAVGHEADVLEAEEQLHHRVDVVGVVAALQQAGAGLLQVGLLAGELFAGDAVAEGHSTATPRTARSRPGRAGGRSGRGGTGLPSGPWTSGSRRRRSRARRTGCRCWPGPARRSGPPPADTKRRRASAAE